MSKRLVMLTLLLSGAACSNSPGTATGTASTSGGLTGGQTGGSNGTSGGANSLSGPLAIDFQAVIAGEGRLSDSGVDTSAATVGFFDSSPVFDCSAINAPSTKIFGSVQIMISTANGTHITPGTMVISSSRPLDAGEFASLSVMSATTPPGPNTASLANALSGTLQLDQAGPTWVGTFTSTVLQLDGGQTSLSGAFDTSTTCVVP